MFCLDTYALVEIHHGNEKFATLLRKKCVITHITLAEFYGLLYRKYNKQTATYWYKTLLPLVVSVETDTLIAAITFRVDNAQKKLSFFDCVGHIYAQEHNMKFVTGDKEFKCMDGVFFLK